MFYDAAKRDHGLAQDPLKSLIVPRPIGWISTVDGQGRVNLAPYSFYNARQRIPADGLLRHHRPLRRHADQAQPHERRGDRRVRGQHGERARSPRR